MGERQRERLTNEVLDRKRKKLCQRMEEGERERLTGQE